VVWGVDEYPRNQLEFGQRFAQEDDCWQFLREVRWPGGFACPGCGGKTALNVRRDLWRCAGCQRETSVTSGTILGGSHLPLQIWFRAMWQVTQSKQGCSALELQRALGLGSYRTAWLLLHKLRRAMVRPGRELLRGEVEVDEFYWGAPEKGKNGRQSGAKQLIVVATEVVGAKLGRIRLQSVPTAAAAELVGFIRATVCAGTRVRTDAWRGYASLAKAGFRHEVVNLRGDGELAVELLPSVHLVASLFQRWLLTTHQGAIQPEYLPHYLEEFTFRFNRRTSRFRGLLFLRLVQQAVQQPPVPARNLRPTTTHSG